MKRIMAVALALVLALGCIGALAEDYTVDEKFVGQMQNNAVRGELTFAITGMETAAVEPAVWAALRALLPGLSLEAEHSITRGEGQATVQIKMNGETAAVTDVMYDDTLVGFASDLLAGKNVYYTAPVSWDFSRIMQAVAQQDGAWPPLWHVLLAVETAPQSWQDRAAEYRSLYDTKMGAWINSYASTTGNTENGVMYTELSCTIPAQAVKAQIKQLLIDLYADEGLLALLREVLTAEEAAAYLQPGMRDTFFSVIDQAQITGNVRITRRYDIQGNLLMDSITLPFTEGSQVSELKIENSVTNEGQQWDIHAVTQYGNFAVTGSEIEPGIYTGKMDFTPENVSAFPMGDDAVATDVKPVHFDYNLDVEIGEDTFDLASDTYSRAFRYTLLLKPTEDSDMPPQSLTLNAVFSSKSNVRAATALNATLTWTDMDSSSSITANLSARTAVTWAVDSVDSLTGAMRIDQLDGDGWAALTQRWLQNAQSWLQQFTSRIVQAIPSALPQG